MQNEGRRNGNRSMQKPLQSKGLRANADAANVYAGASANARADADAANVGAGARAGADAHADARAEPHVLKALDLAENRAAAARADAEPATPPATPTAAPPARLKKALKLVLLMGSIGLGIALIIGVGVYVYLLTTPLPQAYIPQTSQILDYNGEVIDTLHSGQNRQVVRLEQVSPYVINATLAIEDHRFYSHFGIDLYGLGRAAWVDLRHMSMSQGASTLTQQLARNLYLTHEKTWSRKAKEALLALQIEMKYSKRDILTQYLNQIYYGHATYGIQAASKLFFDKDAKHLTLAESALLAGVPKGPRFYSPYMDEEGAIARQHLVLQAMVNHNYITQVEADEAKKEQLTFNPLQKRPPSEAPHFRDYIRLQAMALLGLDEEAFNEGGFIIHTALDMRLQRLAEQIIEERLHDTELQAALIAIDPRNGYMKAMIGGRDYPNNQYNRVFATSRQPGSTFKPFLYLAALEQGGFSATTQFKSEPTVFSFDEGRGTYAPKNYGNRYLHDFIDLRKAISTSDNIFAVHTIMEIGAEQVIDVARRFGMNGQMEPLPSLALGTFPISPYELASAFSTIANQGVYTAPTAILHITDGRGRLLYEHEPEAEHVIDAAYTYVLTSMLEGVFEPGGTGHRVAWMIKRPVAAKTGTTNTDAWMAGFTPELATAVWIGYDRDRTLGSTEALHAAPIFAQFTEQALEHVPPKLFSVPDHIVSLYIDPHSGHIATEQCPEARLEHFVQGSEPTHYCTMHRTDLDWELDSEFDMEFDMELDMGLDTKLKGIAPLEPVAPLEHQVELEHDSWWQQLKRWWNE